MLKLKALCAISSIYCLLGLAYIFTVDGPITPATTAQVSIMPLQAWGFVFLLFGCVGLFYARKRNLTEGFSYLLFLSSFWTMLYIVSLLITGYSRSIAGTLTWLLISVCIYSLSVG